MTNAEMDSICIASVVNTRYQHTHWVKYHLKSNFIHRSPRSWNWYAKFCIFAWNWNFVSSYRHCSAKVSLKRICGHWTIFYGLVYLLLYPHLEHATVQRNALIKIGIRTKVASFEALWNTPLNIMQAGINIAPVTFAFLSCNKALLNISHAFLKRCHICGTAVRYDDTKFTTA